LCRFAYPANGRVQHLADSGVTRHAPLVVRYSGHTAATGHASCGADCDTEGAATVAGASAVISIANPIATLRQIEINSNMIVRHGLSRVGIVPPLMMTCMGNLRLEPTAPLPSAFTS
jgi:hypothetical protein